MNNCPLISIHCLVYNHEATLRQCLDGIVMQQTEYSFEAIVHDDASTDSSPAIIREYAERYPAIIKPILETENQYHKGTLRDIMDRAMRGTYVAICEGDDAWLDPLKLQKQVGYLEGHPDCSMVCSDAIIRTEQGDLTEEALKRRRWPRYHESRDATVPDLIVNGGWFLHTASLVYRRHLKEDYPQACRLCCIDDWPTQIFMGLKGKVHYFDEKMVLYRFAMGGSWTSKNLAVCSPEVHLPGWRSQQAMLEALDEYSGRRYHIAFRLAETQLLDHVIRKYPALYPTLMQECGSKLRTAPLPPARTEEERAMLRLFKKKWRRIRSHTSYDLRFLGISLASCIRNSSGTVRRLLGVKVWEKEVGEKYIVYRLMGIPIRRKLTLAWRLRHGCFDA